MPGASHSFLRQICEPAGGEIRACLDRALAQVSPALRLSLEERLSSLDNRVFFQGFSELLVTWSLARAGWTLEEGSSGRLLQGVRPDGQRTNVLVLGFIHSQRPGLEHQGVRRLVGGVVHRDIGDSVPVRVVGRKLDRQRPCRRRCGGVQEHDDQRVAGDVDAGASEHAADAQRRRAGVPVVDLIGRGGL